MRIAILSWESLHSIPVGGIAVHVTELAAALTRAGHEVHVITRMGAGQPAYSCIDGVHYHRCVYDWRPHFIQDVYSMCGAFTDRVFQIEDYSGRVDIVHGHDWMTAKAAAWTRQGRGKRVVMTFHSTEYGRAGNYFHEGDSRTIRDLEWEAQYVADEVIAVSNTLREEIIRIYSTPPDKICTIYNGVNPGLFSRFVDQGQVKQRYGIGPLDPLVLYVGRMVYQKGPDLLLEVVPRVLQSFPQARFAFVGDGDMRRGLEHRAGELGVAHAVRFLGARYGDELVDIYLAADVVCVPSRNEPFGIVILEAWSAGKPVVACSNGGPSEFVWHGVTGLKCGLLPEDISSALVALLERRDYAQWIGRNGRTAVETTFSWDRIAARTLEVYERVLNGKGGGLPQ